MLSPLQAVVDLVAAHGMDREKAEQVAYYLADRSSGLRISTIHSSGHSALAHDEFLTCRMGLTVPQIRAWMALLRGTRPVRRANGHIVGGCPGYLEAILTGPVCARQMQRYQFLARRAAGAGASGWYRPGGTARASRDGRVAPGAGSTKYD